MAAIWGRQKRGRYANPYNPFSHLVGNLVHIEQEKKFYEKIKKIILLEMKSLKRSNQNWFDYWNFAYFRPGLFMYKMENALL